MSRYIPAYSVIELEVKNGQITGNERLNNDQRKALESGYAIYLYRSEKTGQIYIGQTTNFNRRHKEHFSGAEEKFNKAKFTEVIVMFYENSNRSSLDDIESQLITYFIADNPKGKPYKIINAQAGNTVNDYREKESVATDVILPFWDDYLYTHKWVRTKQTKLRESALVKYSPIKALTSDQNALISEVTNNPEKNYVINGDAGTGKTVLLTHLVARMLDQKKRVCVVVQGNWKGTAKKIFKIYGMNTRDLAVKTPITFIKNFRKNKEYYDAIIIDEAHRLFRDYRKGQNFWTGTFEDEFEDCGSHLEIIQKIAAKKTQVVLMYDVLQSVRPSCITREMFADLTEDYEKRFLKTQFRICAPENKPYTSEDYMNGIKFLLFKDTGLLESQYASFDPEFNREVFRDISPDAYFGYFSDAPLKNSLEWINDKNIYNPSDSNRIVAGYVMPWRRKEGKDPSIKHWCEGDIRLRWNSSHENWINSSDEDAKEQVGSVYAVQGIDINRAAVIIGPDLKVDSNGRLYGDPDCCCDENMKFKAEDVENDPEACAREFTIAVLNSYYILMTRGIDAVRFAFWDNDGVMEYMKKSFDL